MFKELFESKQVLYHGDNSKTTYINHKYMNNGNMQEGPGIYFSSNIDVAYGYGKNVVKIETSDTFIPSRDRLSSVRQLSRVVYKMLVFGMKTNKKDIFYEISDYTYIEDIEDLNVGHIREYVFAHKDEEIRNVFIGLIDILGTKLFQELWEKYLPKVAGLYNKELQFFSVIKKIKIQAVLAV